GTPTPDEPFEFPYGPTVVNMYAQCAMRHMYEFGTTAEQLAWIKVAASHHAQYNPHALLKDVVTVEQVVNSPIISDPLHRLDCCVITDGGGAIVVVAPEIAAKLKRPKVKLIGAGEFVKTQMGGKVDLTYSGARVSGAAAFAEAGVRPSDIKFAAIYDSFTITVLMQLEDLGFCEKCKRGAFVAKGKLLVRKCTSCGQLHHYPRTICPFCFSDKTEWVEASGKGTIYSYSVMRRAPVPYAMAYVTLAEGPRMVTNIVDCDFDKLKVEQAVKLVFKPTDGGPP